MESAIVVVVVVFAGLRGRRLEVEGWGDGIIDTQSMQNRCPHENARAAFWSFFHPETRCQKSVFTGSMWMIDQNDAKHVSLPKAFPCEWALSFPPIFSHCFTMS